MRTEKRDGERERRKEWERGSEREGGAKVGERERGEQIGRAHV